MRYYGFLTAATTPKIAFVFGCTRIVVAAACGIIGRGGCGNALHQTQQRGVVRVHFTFGRATVFLIF